MSRGGPDRLGHQPGNFTINGVEYTNGTKTMTETKNLGYRQPNAIEDIVSTGELDRLKDPNVELKQIIKGLIEIDPEKITTKGLEEIQQAVQEQEPQQDITEAEVAQMVSKLITWKTMLRSQPARMQETAQEIGREVVQLPKKLKHLMALVFFGITGLAGALPAFAYNEDSQEPDRDRAAVVNNGLIYGTRRALTGEPIISSNGLVYGQSEDGLELADPQDPGSENLSFLLNPDSLNLPGGTGKSVEDEGSTEPVIYVTPARDAGSVKAYSQAEKKGVPVAKISQNEVVPTTGETFTDSEGNVWIQVDISALATPPEGLPSDAQFVYFLSSKLVEAAANDKTDRQESPARTEVFVPTQAQYERRFPGESLDATLAFHGFTREQLVWNAEIGIATIPQEGYFYAFIPDTQIEFDTDEEEMRQSLVIGVPGSIVQTDGFILGVTGRREANFMSPEFWKKYTDSDQKFGLAWMPDGPTGTFDADHPFFTPEQRQTSFELLVEKKEQAFGKGIQGIQTIHVLTDKKLATTRAVPESYNDGFEVQELNAGVMVNTNGPYNYTFVISIGWDDRTNGEYTPEFIDAYKASRNFLTGIMYGEATIQHRNLNPFSDVLLLTPDGIIGQFELKNDPELLNYMVKNNMLFYTLVPVEGVSPLEPEQ